MTSEFDAHYQTYIKPKVDAFEELRLYALDTYHFRKKFIIPVVAFVGLIVGAGVALKGWKIDNLILALVLGGAVYGYAYLAIYQYKTNIKEEIYPLIFKYFGEDFTYKSTKLLDKNQHSYINAYKPSEIIPRYSSGQVDDRVSGSYQGVEIELLEVTLQTGGRDTEDSKTMFSGLFIALTMNKKFQGKTIVHADSGALGNWLVDKIKRAEKVRLEDPRFEKIFEVYSTDQVEARYLLTPAFMERLMQLKDLFHGGKGNFQASFYDNRLLLTVPAEKKFEVGSVNEPVTFTHEINTILTEMQKIFEIIDVLKLNETTGI